MKKGLIIGKFMPLHRGHCFLIDMALAMCDELHICLCSRLSEPISGEFRVQCLRAQYPQAIVHHITKEIEDAHADNPLAPKIWSEEIQKQITTTIEYVFASEQYGKEFATHLGAEFVMADPNRLAVPVSGAQIRSNLYQYWDYLAPAVKSYLVKVVGIKANDELAYKFTEQVGALYCSPYSQTVLGGSLGKDADRATDHKAPQASTTLYGVSKQEANPEDSPEAEATEPTQKTQYVMLPELFRLAVQAEMAALKTLEYPLVVWHYAEHRKIVDKDYIASIDYEHSLLDNVFTIHREQDLALAIAWWQDIERANILEG